MSIIGTGIAAGVANAGQAAKQTNASQSGKDAQRADRAKQTDKFVAQLHEAAATRDADQDLPDGQAPGYEDLYHDTNAQDQDDNPNDQIHHTDAPQSSSTGVPLQPTYGPAAKHHPLFHAIDLKA
ncbi:MAG: hypothetical protein ACPGYV_03285 [Phycisphaeraceae bacterium]